MLVLSRQRDETIIIGDDIEITVVDIRGDKVRLGVTAPKEISVHRKEVYEAIRRENREAAQVRPEDLSGLGRVNPGAMPPATTGAAPAIGLSGVSPGTVGKTPERRVVAPGISRGPSRIPGHSATQRGPVRPGSANRPGEPPTPGAVRPPGPMPPVPSSASPMPAPDPGAVPPQPGHEPHS